VFQVNWLSLSLSLSLDWFSWYLLNSIWRIPNMFRLTIRREQM
jgi:hypothetical protein